MSACSERRSKTILRGPSTFKPSRGSAIVFAIHRIPIRRPAGAKTTKAGISHVAFLPKGLPKGAIMATRVLLGILFLIQGTASAQATAPSTPAPPAAEAGTSNDLFVMFGSDFVRPGLEPKANY